MRKTRIIPILLTFFFLLVGLVGDLGAEVVISEIMYNPAADNTGGEFVEIYNTGDAAVDVSGWKLVDSAQEMLALPEGTMIAAGGYLVFYDDEAAVDFYGQNAEISYGPYAGGLSGDGERIQLKDAGGTVVDEVSYDDNWPWPPQADGDGPSLELLDAGQDNTNPANWGVGQPYSPGRENEPTLWGEGDIIISEIMYHPGPTNWGGEYIELYNRSAAAVDLTKWKLEGGVDYTIPDATMLGVGEYLVIAGDPNVAAYYALAAGEILGPYERDLGNSGDLVVLRDAAGIVAAVVNYNDQAPWPTEADGAGPSLELLDVNGENNDPANWGIGQLYTPGAANAPAISGGGNIAISEIMYQPLKKRYMATLNGYIMSNAPNQGKYWQDGDDPVAEYIELYNRSGGTVNLAGWKLLDEEGVLYAFPSGTIAAGAYKVVCSNVSAIASRYSISNAVGNFATSGDRLANGGERLTLVNGSGVVVDTVRYNDLPPWPIGPDQTGVALECLNPALDNSRAENWRGCTVAAPSAPASPAVGDEYFLNRGTPGKVNSRTSGYLPPFVDVEDIKHSPKRPTSADEVLVTAEVSSDYPITAVSLVYQVFVAPYQTAAQSATIPMYDDGTHGDLAAGDGKFSVTLAAQGTKTLVRYRVAVTDSHGSWTYPDSYEPNPNRAYFVYDGNPDRNLQEYFLIAPDSTWNYLYANIWTHDYQEATLVAEGMVYDHIGVHLKGMGWRVHPKKSYKLSFNKNEYLRDMSRLDLSMHVPVVQKLVHDVFSEVGQVNLGTELVRIYRNGEFYGVYLATESTNSSWLERHGMDGDGEVYKASCLPTGNGYVADLRYYSDAGLYPQMYEKKGDALGSFDSLIELCDQMTNTPEAQIVSTMNSLIDLDTWLYNWAVQVAVFNDDLMGQNFFVVKPAEPGAKWRLQCFDLTGSFNWRGTAIGPFEGIDYQAQPFNYCNRWQVRVANNATLKNRFLTILADVLDHYMTIEQVHAMVDEYYDYTLLDRTEEIASHSDWTQYFAGPFVMQESNRDSIKSFYTNRWNWLKDTWLPSQGYTPPANAHPTIQITGVSRTSSGFEIQWQYADAESNPCTVDLYWLDKQWSQVEPIPGGQGLPAADGSFLWNTGLPDKEYLDRRICIHAVIRDTVSDLPGHDTSPHPLQVWENCQQVLDAGHGLAGDINQDCRVNLEDLAMFLNVWLTCYDPQNPDCTALP